MKYRLLIVDDEELIRKGLIARLEYLHMEFESVREAASGSEAMRALEQEGADIAITDIRMADMDGLTFIRRAQEKYPRMKFAVLSGYAEFEYAEQAIDLGVKAYLLKPLSNEELKKVMERLISMIEEEASMRSAVRMQRAYTREKREYLLERELNWLLDEPEEGPRARQKYPTLLEACPALLEEGPQDLYLVVINIDSKSYERHNFQREDSDLVRFSVKNIFDEVETSCEKLAVSSLSKNNQLYAIFGRGSVRALRKEIEHTFLKMQGLLEEKMEVFVTFGVSSGVRTAGLACRREANDALKQRMAYGRSNVYFYEDMVMIREMKFPVMEMNMLSQYLERRDMANIQAMIWEIFSEERIRRYHAPYIRMMWMRVLNLLLRSLGNGIRRSEQMELMLNSFSALEEVDSIEELKERYLKIVEACVGDEVGAETNARDKIRMAVSYINDHYNENIVINELAERYGMSPNYFSSLFKKELKQSTVNYITDLRIARAMEYLRSSNLNVVEIAKTVGYEDSQYFFRVFKKATGVTPLQYRQQDRR